MIGAPKRVTYVTDKQGIVRAAIHHEMFMQRHADDVRETLGKMKESAQD